MDTHFPLSTHIFHVNENLERFPHVGNILSIKACFWGSRNFCNRWTLVTCQVDNNWTSEGSGYQACIQKIKFIKSPKQRLETYCFCSVSYYYYSCSCSCSCSSPFFLCTMNLSTADLRNYRTEFHETWWSYRYMFLVDPKVFRFVVKGVKAIFLGVQRGWGLL